MQDSIDSSKEIVNLDYLNKIAKGNKSFVKEMIGIFLSENPEEIKILEKGIENKNFESIKSTAHKLRSTLPFVGLDKVIEKEVIEVETLAADNADIGEIKTLFSKIKKMCEKACWELQPV